MTRTGDKNVTDKHALSRYEIEVNGDLAGFSAYQRRGDMLIFTETARRCENPPPTERCARPPRSGSSRCVVRSARGG